MAAAKLLLEHCADPNAESKAGSTPLHLAARKGHDKMVSLLIEHHANINSTAKNGFTPLHVCAYENKLNVATVLVKNGAILNIQASGLTPLQVAAKLWRIDIFKYLHQFGNDTHATSYSDVQDNPQCNVDSPNFIRHLLENGASPNNTDQEGFAPLHHAATKNQLEKAKILLEYGANPNIQEKDGLSPLHFASYQGHADMASLLIEHNADVHLPDKNGLTPLHVCAKAGKVNVATVLVKYGAKLDLKAKDGLTPLSYAKKFLHFNMVTFLEKNGARDDIQCDDNGVNTMRCLLEQGANSNTIEEDGETPLLQAASSNHLQNEYEEELTPLHLASNPVYVEMKGCTPLHYCAMTGNVDIAKVLVAHGADLEARTNDGFTPLHIAVDFGHYNMCKFLLECGSDINAKVSNLRCHEDVLDEKGNCATEEKEREGIKDEIHGGSDTDEESDSDGESGTDDENDTADEESEKGEKIENNNESDTDEENDVDDQNDAEKQSDCAPGEGDRETIIDEIRRNFEASLSSFERTSINMNLRNDEDEN